MPSRSRLNAGGNRRAIVLVSLAAAGSGLFLAGRWSAARTAVAAAARESGDAGSASADTERWRTRLRAVTVPVWPQAATEPNADAERAANEARAQRAEFLLGRVFKQMERQSHTDRDLVPEARAERVRDYLTGTVMGAIHADPQMRSAFSQQFTAALCNRSPKPEEIISLAHVAQAVPDVPTREGFDCFFEKKRTAEDAPLWSMLDAWRDSGQEKSPALARLQAAAKDERTARRFLSNEEAAAQRTPAEYRSNDEEGRMR